MEQRFIDLKLIDLADKLYQIDHSNKAKLKKIKLKDFYNPVWLQSVNSNQFRIIDGFSIVKLAEKQKIKQIPAFVFDSDTDLFELYKKRIAKRISEDNFPFYGFVKSLLAFLTQAQIEKKELELFLRQSGFKDLALTLDLFKKLKENETILITFIDLEKLTFNEAQLLFKQRDLELEKLSIILKGLNLSGNKLSSILKLLKELKSGFGWSLDKLAEKGLTALPEDQGPLNFRYKNLKDNLMKLRFPRLSARQNEWAEAFKKIELPKGVTLEEDLTFESDEITLKLTPETIGELINQLDQLKHLTDSEELKKLFEFV